MGQPDWGQFKPNLLANAAIAISNIAHRRRKIRKYARRLAIRQSEIFDLTRDGMKLRCTIADNVTEQEIVFSRRRKRWREISKLIPHLPEGGTFVDIGANCGLFALLAASRIGPSGRVLAIEANPVMLERLNFNIEVNGLRNVEVIGCAVGDEVGTAELRVDARQLGLSSLVIEVGPRIEVVVRTLPEIIRSAELTHIDAMKIDIEGFEDRALMPLLHDVPREIWPRRILIETVHACYWREGCVHRLREAGYTVAWQSLTDMLLIDQ